MSDLVAGERVFAFYSDVEQELRSSVRAAIAQRCPLGEVARRFDAPDPDADRELWKVLGGQLGLAGLLVSEAHGGAGATAREAAVVLEEVGRAVAPVPYLTSAVWATVLLGEVADAAGPDAGADVGGAGEVGAASSAASWGTLAVAGALAALADGGPIAAVVARADIVPGRPFPGGAVTVDVDAGTGAPRLNGSVRAAAGARDADLLIVPASSAGRACLILVRAGARGLGLAPVVSLDESAPLADIVFKDCAGEILAVGHGVDALFDRALIIASALLASEQLGVAEHCLEQTVAYVKTRHQFGRTIGSFQVVKHRLADLWAQVEGARTAARYAATCAAIGSDDLPVAAALAAAYCSEAAVKAAEECVQLHGGIGFTWEHPAHLWLKRAMSQAVMFGGADAQRARLAELVDLQAP